MALGPMRPDGLPRTAPKIFAIAFLVLESWRKGEGADGVDGVLMPFRCANGWEIAA